MSNILKTFNVREIKVAITEKLKTSLKKFKIEKIKTIIEIIVILIKIACITKFLKIVFAIYILII